jgi:uncharacterized membrane protein YgdD (TMEM256/DUF423 family)
MMAPLFMFRSALLLASLLVAAVASAQPVSFDQALEAREVAMGGAYRALGTSAVAIDGNPAALGLFKAFQVDVGGAYDFAEKTWYVAGYVRDSQTSVLSGGYSFHLLSQQMDTSTGTTTVTGIQQVLALALPVADYMTVGVSSHWLIESDLNINAASLDVGAAFKLGKLATLGFAGHNLLDTHHPLELGRYFDLSGGLQLGPLTLALDTLSNFGPKQFHPQFLFGAEVALGKIFLLRAGTDFYTRTTTAAQDWFLTAGFGFNIDKGGFDIGYRQSLSGDGSLFVASLRIVL